MTFILHCSRLLEKQLETLRRSGSRGRSAANQCVNLLNTMRSEGIHSDEIIRKRTKNGELRLAHCIKYDLGHGYRLVTVLHGKHLFATFAGSHDKTDQWLDQNRNSVYNENTKGFGSEFIHSSKDNPVHVLNENNEASLFPEPDLYEEYLLSQVDDEMLRTIFSGLVKQHNSNG